MSKKPRTIKLKEREYKNPEEELNVLEQNKVFWNEDARFGITEVDDKFIELTKYINKYQLDVCTKHPQEMCFTQQHFNQLFKSFYGRIDPMKIQNSPKMHMVYYNNLYLYPNMDKFFFHKGKNKRMNYLNNPLNPNFNGTLDNAFSVRFDLKTRHKPMVALQLYNMLVLDYDTKDFFDTVTPETIKQTKDIVRDSFQQLCDNAKRDFDLELIWCIAETDKGIHLFLVNHYIDVKNEFWSRFLTLLCCDLMYAVFSRAHSFCIRLSKKAGREKDIVAELHEPEVKFGLPSEVSNRNNFIYPEGSDLSTVKPDLIKILKFKYRLIKYFKQLTYKDLEFVSWQRNADAEMVKEYLNLIRGHMKEIWSSIGEVAINEHNIFDDDVKQEYKTQYSQLSEFIIQKFRNKEMPPLIDRKTRSVGKKKNSTKKKTPSKSESSSKRVRRNSKTLKFG